VLRRMILPGVLMVAGYYAVFGGEYSILDVRQIQAEIAAARETVAELEQLTDSLQARADSLEFDDRTLETIARERFGLIREGEILYRFPVYGDEEEG
jgi:cell division protein FtsB